MVNNELFFICTRTIVGQSCGLCTDTASRLEDMTPIRIGGVGMQQFNKRWSLILQTEIFPRIIAVNVFHFEIPTSHLAGQRKPLWSDRAILYVMKTRIPTLSCCPLDGKVNFFPAHCHDGVVFLLHRHVSTRFSAMCALAYGLSRSSFLSFNWPEKFNWFIK